MSNEVRKMKNDVAEFFIGLVMICVGGYLFSENVTVFTGNIFSVVLFGRQMEGVIFFPLIASIIFLFYRYNWVSKTCCVISVVLILVNVIMNLKMFYMPTTLFATILIFVLLFGGAGLVMRVLFANPDGKHGKDYTK